MKKKIIGLLSAVVLTATALISCSNNANTREEEYLNYLGHEGDIYVYEDVQNGNIVYTNSNGGGIAVMPKHEVKGE